MFCLLSQTLKPGVIIVGTWRPITIPNSGGVDAPSPLKNGVFWPRDKLKAETLTVISPPVDMVGACWLREIDCAVTDTLASPLTVGLFYYLNIILNYF
jgi:hypothetical protein